MFLSGTRVLRVGPAPLTLVSLGLSVFSNSERSEIASRRVPRLEPDVRSFAYRSRHYLGVGSPTPQQSTGDSRYGFYPSPVPSVRARHTSSRRRPPVQLHV